MARKNSKTFVSKRGSVDFGAESSFGGGEELQAILEEDNKGIINLINSGPKTRNRPMTANLIGRGRN